MTVFSTQGEYALHVIPDTLQHTHRLLEHRGSKKQNVQTSISIRDYTMGGSSVQLISSGNKLNPSPWSRSSITNLIHTRRSLFDRSAIITIYPISPLGQDSSRKTRIDKQVESQGSKGELRPTSSPREVYPSRLNRLAQNLLGSCVSYLSITFYEQNA